MFRFFKRRKARKKQEKFKQAKRARRLAAEKAWREKTSIKNKQVK